MRNDNRLILLNKGLKNEEIFPADDLIQKNGGWSRGQMEICELFWEFVAPPGKRNLIAIMTQRHVLET